MLRKQRRATTAIMSTLFVSLLGCDKPQVNSENKTTIASAGADSSAIAKDAPSDVPSDVEVVSAIVSEWNKEDNEQLASLKSNVFADDKAVKELMANVRDCDKETQSRCTNKNMPEVDLDQTVFSVNGDMEGCISFVRNQCDAAFRKIQKQIQQSQDQLQQSLASLADFKYRKDQYDIKVVQTNNYEGNVISYVNIRTKGSDEIMQYKALIKGRNDTWVLEKLDEYSRVN